jgi:predicted metal-binding protein
MSKHTPGPWIARRMACQSDSHTFNSEVVTTEGECVVSLVRKADSQLIAAAPDMLEALELALIALGDEPHCDYGNCDDDCIACRIESAIAKAKGVDREHSN